MSTTAATSEHAPANGLPLSRLSVKARDAWRVFWLSSRPERPSPLAVDWRPVHPGLEYAELDLAGSGEAWRTKLIVARLDPNRLRLSLVLDIEDGGAAWTIDKLKSDALFAVNAGQFAYAVPWGWVLLNGKEYFASGTGPLASAFIVDSSGAVHWVHSRVPSAESRERLRAAWAFQSYPTLLRDGHLPSDLLGGSKYLDVAHRDARAAIGTDADGHILVALTRFNAFGPSLGFVPFGLTTPEMAGVMASLGAHEAVALDGGISAQMTIASTPRLTWHGARPVPLALVARDR